MLTTLRISGFAVVDQAEVRFGPGLNVLTGETGAGKSLLLEALHLILGGRMSSDVLREGADEAVVEALFELPAGHPVAARLAQQGLPVPHGPAELLVRRTASRAGRGRAFVNGSLCTVGMLESALRGLADVTGQHQHLALLDEATHLALLDAHAAGRPLSERSREGPPPPGPVTAGDLPHRFRAAHAALSSALRERDALLAAREERSCRADYLAYQLRELEAVNPTPGEDAELERERQLLAGARRLEEAARLAEALAYGGEGSASEQLGRATRLLGDVSALDGRLAPVLELLRSAQAEVEEAGRSLARYAECAAGDPERLALVEERQESLRALARKHGGSLEAALARGQAMRDELASLAGGSERLASLEADIGEAGARAVELARELTRARLEAARRFSRDVQRELSALALERCRLEFAFLPPENALVHEGVALGAEGAERVRLMFAPNPGEPPRALARSASGGELSRVLLAVKRCLARADPVDTYVFDEVDAGIGGGVAEAVGRLLSAVSRERQVICVTHLPQVAAFADHHVRVHKQLVAGRTSTAVEALASLEERRAEVARMLAGLTLTESALEHAGALIGAARSPVPATRGRRPASVGGAARKVGGRAGLRPVPGAVPGSLTHRATG